MKEDWVEYEWIPEVLVKARLIISGASILEFSIHLLLF